jgi:hypothetical protein
MYKSKSTVNTQVTRFALIIRPVSATPSLVEIPFLKMTSFGM